jgi:predicted nucleic acid-binding protein
MPARLYLDSSAILRPVLERGLSPAVARQIREADLLVTSRLSLVETARVFLRVGVLDELAAGALADARRQVRALWRRCDVWELTLEVCERAELVAPGSVVRSLDALHLATFALAREEIEDLRFLTADARLGAAADSM